MKTETRKVTVEQEFYIAEDGEEFDDFDDCIQHERNLLEQSLEFYQWSYMPGDLDNCRYVKATTPELVAKLLELLRIDGITTMGIDKPGIYMYQSTSPRQWINISQAVDIIGGKPNAN